MCRLFGISYGDTPERLSTGQIARILFPALTSGGPHAFGWMQNTDGGEVDIRKYVGRADTPSALDKVCGIRRECKWFVGHTRFATHGDPADVRNDHPIRHGNIIGVHNGVLRNHDDILAVTGRYVEGTEVDSEAIFAAVNRWGLTKGMAKVYGSLVTIFTDLRKIDTLWIARSNSRSLTIGWTERGNMIWASEKQALDKLEARGIVFVKMSGVSENRLLTVKDGEIISRTTYREIPARKPYVIPPYQPIARPSDVLAVSGTKRMRAARRAMDQEHGKGQGWHREHYNEDNAPADLHIRRHAQGVREAWDKHLRRNEMIRWLDNNAYTGDDAVNEVHKFFVRYGYLGRSSTSLVLTWIDRGKKPRKSKGKSKKAPASIIGPDLISYNGKVMTKDEYLTAVAETVSEAKQEDTADDWEDDEWIRPDEIDVKQSLDNNHTT